MLLPLPKLSKTTSGSLSVGIAAFARASCGRNASKRETKSDDVFCDALARGKTAEECRAEGKPEHLIPHVTFTGNRQSLSLLLPVLNAYTCGQLLALFEHRTAVQGFIWDINSFDQWGVELGKVLATQVRKTLNQARYQGKDVSGFNSSTTALIKRYLSGSVGCTFDEIIEE